MHDMYRGQGRKITGDSYFDKFDINDPRHFRRAITEVEAAGLEVPAPLRERLKRMLAEQAERDAFPALLAGLEQARSMVRDVAAEAERASTVTFPGVPESDSDVLVIGQGLDHYPGREDIHGNRLQGASTEQDIDDKTYRFDPHQQIHFVPAEVALAWPHRRGLPGSKFSPWPADLLRVYRDAFTRLKPGGRQNTGPAFSEIEVDEKGLLAAAAGVARACSYVPLLTTWLTTARAAGDELNTLLARVIEKRAEELEGSEADEGAVA